MAHLHYQLSQYHDHWLVSCEDVPIDIFDDRQAALSAVMSLVSAAKVRGDQAALQIDPADITDKVRSADN